MKYWQVVGFAGMYDERMDWVVATFNDEGSAQLIRTTLQDHADMVVAANAWWRTGEPETLDEYRVVAHDKLDPWRKGVDKPYYEVKEYEIADDVAHFMRLAKLKHTARQRNNKRQQKQWANAHNHVLDAASNIVPKATSLMAEQMKKAMSKSALAQLASYGQTVVVNLDDKDAPDITGFLIPSKDEDANEVEFVQPRSYLDVMTKYNRKSKKR